MDFAIRSDGVERFIEFCLIPVWYGTNPYTDEIAYLDFTLMQIEFGSFHFISYLFMCSL
jgi:hypothetical protein